jgi:hypothetical protein
LGHFEHDGEITCFKKNPSDSTYRPVVRRSLDAEAIAAVLWEVTGTKVNDLAFPADWWIRMDDGYLVCDKYTRNRKMIDFVAQLVKRTSCDIHDVSAHCDITLHDWVAVTRSYAQS